MGREGALSWCGASRLVGGLARRKKPLCSAIQHVLIRHYPLIFILPKTQRVSLLFSQKKCALLTCILLFFVRNMSLRKRFPQSVSRRKTRVAILGNSYCRGFGSYVNQLHNGTNLNQRDCDVHWFANAGGTAKKAIRFDPAAIEHAKPDVCVACRK